MAAGRDPLDDVAWREHTEVVGAHRAAHADALREVAANLRYDVDKHAP